MIESLEVDGYLMGVGGKCPSLEEYENYFCIWEQLYAQMMGWA